MSEKFDYRELDQEWRILETKYTSGLLTKKLTTISKKKILIAVDEGSMKILVEQEKNAPQTESLEIMQGLQIESKILEIKEKNDNYFIVSCENDYRATFPPFTIDFLNELKEHEPNIAFHKAHTKAKKYWKGKKPKLSPDEQRGLFGELVVLNELSLRSSFEQIVPSWTGPLDLLHDFEGALTDIEVKTTTREPPIVRISQINQVSPPDSKELTLSVIQLNRQKKGQTLPEMVESTRKNIDEQKYNGEGFEELLKTVGYMDKHQLYYTTKYVVSNVLFCPIEKDTPILDPAVLGKIPETVIDIAYSLRISGLKRYTPTNQDWIDLKNKIID